MENDNIVKLMTSSSITINRLASLLDENGIPTLIKDNVSSATAAGFGIPINSVELYVNASDLENAQKIAETYTP